MSFRTNRRTRQVYKIPHRLGELGTRNELASTHAKYKIPVTIPYSRKQPSKADENFNERYSGVEVNVPISRIITYQRFNDSRGIKTYINAIKRSGPKILPPVKISKVGHRFVVQDGNHRIEALRLLGYKEVKAEIIE